MKIPNIFIPEKNFENNLKKVFDKEVSVKTVSDYTRFEIVYADTYAECIAKMKGLGMEPFTIFENIEARIADYEINGENTELFNNFLDSITGVAYKAKSTKFKIIPKSSQLKNIIFSFNQEFIPTDYDSGQGIELDSKKSGYNKLLTKEEAKNHEFWLAIMNGDKEKLAKYVDFWFDKTKKKKGFGINLRGNTSQDELRSLVLYDSRDNFGVSDINFSFWSAIFVWGA